MSKYVKCPRCDLNYIREEQEYCDVCKAEMKGKKLLFANDDEEEIDAEATELCPICKQNYIRSDEEMCKACREEAVTRREDDLDMDKDEAWREYLEDEKDDGLEDPAFVGIAADADEDESLDSDSYTGEKTDSIKNSEPDDFEILPIDEKDFSEDAEIEEDEEDEEDDF